MRTSASKPLRKIHRLVQHTYNVYRVVGNEIEHHMMSAAHLTQADIFAIKFREAERESAQRFDLVAEIGAIGGGLFFTPSLACIVGNSPHIRRRQYAKFYLAHLGSNSSIYHVSMSKLPSTGLASPASKASISLDLKAARSSCRRRASRITSLVEPNSPDCTLLRA